uniref:DNA damage-binding protein 1 n=1 Tax=Schistosoma mansoni TaxID=6183 RepID=A0A3Q0KTB3_SCHMA
MAHFYHVTTQRPTAVVKTCTGHFTSPNDLNLLICKNTYVEVFEVTCEGLKLVRDVPINAKIVAASLFRRKDRETDSLFLLTHKAGVAIIECVRNNDSVEFVTVASGSVEDRSARIIDQGFDVLIDPGANYIVVRLYHGLLKIILLQCIGEKIGTDFLDTNQWTVNTYSVRIEEGNIVDMAFIYGYSLPTFAMIYEDELVLHMKTYEIYGREPVLRNVQLTLDSIEPDSKLLIPVPKPYGGVILVGDNIICYHTKDGPHISQYIPQAKASQVLCYAAVDAQRYLLGDMAGRLYMVHLLSEDISAAANNGTSNSDSLSAVRIGSIRIELLGETATPESIAYLDNGVVFIGSTLGDSQLIRLNPDPDPERNSYITILETYTNIGPIVDMVLLETKGQNQLITCSGAYKEGSLRVIRNGIGIHEHATIDQDLIKGAWCFPIESDRFDDTIVVSMVGQTQLLHLADDDITALHLEGFKTDEQTVYCATLSPANDSPRPESMMIDENNNTLDPLLLQATTSGLRLIGIQSLCSKGCLTEWKPPTGRGISCLSSFRHTIVVASGTELYVLKVVGESNNPKFEQVSHRQMSHEVACIDLTPFNRDRAIAAINAVSSNHLDSTSSSTPDKSVPYLVAVGLWLGHGLALLKLPNLELVHEEPLPETTASTGTALLPRSVLIAQLEDIAYLFAAMGDGTLYFYTIDPSEDHVCLRDPKRVSAGTGPSMFLRQWRSQRKVNVFVCSNHPCVIYSIKNKLIFANLNLKEVNFMTPLNGLFYSDCIALVTPTALIIGSVDEIQKLHVRTLPLEETPKRLALQSETSSLGVITYRQEMFQEGMGFKPVRSSISLSQKIPKSASRLPKTAPSSVSATERKFREIEVSSLLIFNQSNLEIQFAHNFYFSQTLVEVAVSIASVQSDIHNGPLFAVGTAFLVEDEVEPSKGRIHLFRWDPESSRLDTVLVHDVNGSVYRIVDFNGRLLAAINSSVRLFDIKEDSLRLACSFNENIIVLFLRRKGDFVLVGDLMRSLTLLLFKSNVNNFEAIGRHRHPRWTTCIEILDDEHFLAAEVENNLFVVSRDLPENTKEPSFRALLSSSSDSCVLPSLSNQLQSNNASSSKTTGLSTQPDNTTNDNIAASSTSSNTTSMSSISSVAEGRSSSTQSTRHFLDSRLTGSKPNSSGVSGEMQRLVDCAYFHTGDFVNVFVRGNLVLQNAEERWTAVGYPGHLYGTVNGGLGLLVQVSPVLFAFLKEVEFRLSNLVVPVGGFSHDTWRAFKADREIKMAHNFVDGDLIETVTDLSMDDKAKLVKGLRIPVNMNEFGTAGSTCTTDPETRECTVEDLVKVVEEMSRLH